ncbi:hypothetical protein [Zhongshania sp.]|uniref:hypothetical protein n=1 Tax=Zhongshania sp. TaxID=1971902 RepID=UPI003567D723
MLALVDGDVYKWRYAAAGEYDSYLVVKDDEEFYVRGIKKAKEATKEGGSYELVEHVIDPVENVLHSVKISLEQIKKVCGCKTPRIFYGSKDNFREKIYPQYKASRADRPKPHHYEAVIDYLVSTWGAEEVVGYEADDAMAIHQTKDTVICSPDKDLLQVPGRHYNFVSDERITVSLRQADFNLYEQIITGDSTDDIPGIKGLGPVKARRILEGSANSRELLARTVKAWEDKVDDMLLTAKLIYLKRSEDDCFTHRPEVKERLYELYGWTE